MRVLLVQQETVRPCGRCARKRGPAAPCSRRRSVWRENTGAHGLVHVAALPGRVAVGQRVVRDVVDGVSVQERFVDHPRRVLHHLVHPPAPALTGFVRLQGTRLQACLRSARALRVSYARSGARPHSLRRAAAGVRQHPAPEVAPQVCGGTCCRSSTQLHARPTQDAAPPWEQPTGACAGAACRAGRRRRPHLQCRSDSYRSSCVMTVFPLYLCVSSSLQQPTSRCVFGNLRRPKAGGVGRPPLAGAVCSSARSRIGAGRAQLLGLLQCPRVPKVEKIKDACGPQRSVFLSNIVNFTTGPAHGSLGRTICIHAHGARAFRRCTARLCGAVGGPWLRCHGLCFPSRLPLGHRVHVWEPYCRTESCNSVPSTQRALLAVYAQLATPRPAPGKSYCESQDLCPKVVRSWLPLAETVVFRPDGVYSQASDK